MFQGRCYKGSEGYDRVRTHTHQSEVMSGKRGEKAHRGSDSGWFSLEMLLKHTKMSINPVNDLERSVKNV